MKDLTKYIVEYQQVIYNLTNLDLYKSIVFPLLIVTAIFLLERKFVPQPQIVEKNSKNTFVWESILYILHYTPILPILSALGSFGIFNLLKILLKIPDYTLFDQINPNLRNVVFILLVDFFAYVSHYILHKNKLLFKFHSFHHSASHFNIVTVHRVHFVEVAFIKVFQTFALVMLGGNAEVFWSYYFLGTVIGHLKHSNFKFNYPGFLKYLIQSPAHHWVHHSKNPKHFDKNFGDNFQIWDFLFGTNYDPSVEEINEIELGLDETQNIKDNFWDLFLLGYGIKRT